MSFESIGKLKSTTSSSIARRSQTHLLNRRFTSSTLKTIFKSGKVENLQAKASQILREKRNNQNRLSTISKIPFSGDNKNETHLECPLIPNGGWVHIPLNWLTMMSSIFDVINKAIQTNDIDILLQLQESNKAFYNVLVGSFSNQTKSTHNKLMDNAEKSLKKIISFTKDSEQLLYNETDFVDEKNEKVESWYIPDASNTGTYVNHSEVKPFHELLDFITSWPKNTIETMKSFDISTKHSKEEFEEEFNESLNPMYLVGARNITEQKEDFQELLRTQFEYDVPLNNKVTVDEDYDESNYEEFNVKYIKKSEIENESQFFDDEYNEIDESIAKISEESKTAKKSVVINDTNKFLQVKNTKTINQRIDKKVIASHRRSKNRYDLKNQILVKKSDYRISRPFNDGKVRNKEKGRRSGNSKVKMLDENSISSSSGLLHSNSVNLQKSYSPDLIQSLSSNLLKSSLPESHKTSAVLRNSSSPVSFSPILHTSSSPVLSKTSSPGSHKFYSNSHKSSSPDLQKSSSLDLHKSSSSGLMIYSPSGIYKTSNRPLYYEKNTSEDVIVNHEMITTKLEENVMEDFTKNKKQTSMTRKEIMKTKVISSKKVINKKSNKSIKKDKHVVKSSLNSSKYLEKNRLSVIFPRQEFGDEIKIQKKTLCKPPLTLQRDCMRLFTRRFGLLIPSRLMSRNPRSDTVDASIKRIFQLKPKDSFVKDNSNHFCQDFKRMKLKYDKKKKYSHLYRPKIVHLSTKSKIRELPSSKLDINDIIKNLIDSPKVYYKHKNVKKSEIISTKSV